MDELVEKHLDAWLAVEHNEDERPQWKAAMKSIYDSAPDYWNERGWRALHDAALASPREPLP